MPYTVTGTIANQGGLRQDLLNVMTQINEVATPLVSRLKTAVALQPTHQWPSDRVTLPADQDAVSGLQGELYVPAQVADFSQDNNLTQIISYPFAISGTMQASAYAGIPDFVAYQKAKGLKYISNGLELSICRGIKSTGNGSTIGWQMAGLEGFANAAYAYTSATGSVASSGLGTATGEDAFKAVLQKMFSKGIRPDFAYMSPKNKALVDLWTSNVVKNLFIENKENSDVVLPAMISVYQSSFGTLELLMSTAMDDDNIVAAQMDMLSIAYLRKPFIDVLPKQYDAWAFACKLEATLQVRDPKSVGLLAIS